MARVISDNVRPANVGRSTSRSAALFERAQRGIPGGVNSPVRAFKAVGGTPVFIDRARGARVWDVDGNEYIDHVLSWGPLILGHAAPEVVAAVQTAATRGTSYGAPTEGEIELAELISRAMPSIELARLVNSGTEATMTAIRVARAATERDKILKFEGCYHGHADGLLSRAGSGPLTLGAPDSPGVPAGAAVNTLTAPFNDLTAVEAVLTANPRQVAAIIVEPVPGNMGVVLPEPGFLAGLRRLATSHGALLIFDEVITGFRVGWGGAQGHFGVTPDLTCLGKIIGGGLPVGAYGGRRDVMALMAPSGPVYQAGTLSGNPLAVAAGLATLRALERPETYPRLEALATRLTDGIGQAAREAGAPLQTNRLGSMLTSFFTDAPVRDYASAKTADTRRYAAFHRAMLDRGVYLAPSQFEAAFVSLAHTEADIDAAVDAADSALRQID